MMELEDDVLSDLASTLAERIVTGDENAIEAAHILGRILAENGFSFGFMVEFQKMQMTLMERKLRRNWRKIFSGGL